MYITNEAPSGFDALDDLCCDMTERLAAFFTPGDRSIELTANESLFGHPQRTGCFFIVLQGTLQCTYKDNLVAIYEPGDLVGFGSHFEKSQCRVFSDFSAKVERYSRAEVFELIANNPEARELFLELLAHHAELYAMALTTALKPEGRASPDLRGFPKGTVIIEEGTPGNEVFNMVEGSAEVFVKGVKVGQVLKGEIFGAIAALTGGMRTASVVAAEDCLALVLPKENFAQLIASRPNTALRMVEDMARVITSLNAQILTYKKEGAPIG